MSESSFNIVNRVDWLLRGVVVIVFLVIVVEIDEIGIIVVAPLPLRAIASEVSLLTALETCVVSRVAGRSLSVGDVSSGRSSASSAPPVGWGAGSVKIH